jgi:hypothetical protein
MIHPIDKYVDIIIKLDISPMQIFFMQILYEKRYDLLYKVANEGHYFTADMIDDLESKGLIINTNVNVRSVYADYYEPTEKFVTLFYDATMRNAEEFWELYPGYITINNKKIPAKGVNKEELVKKYHQTIVTQEKHDMIIGALKYAIDNKLIAIRIDKWLMSEAYIDVCKLMDAETQEDMPHDRLL